MSGMSPPPPLIPPNNTLKLKARLISSQRQTRCSQWAVIGLCLYIFLRHIISATHLYLACMLLASSKLTFLHFLHTMRIEDVTKSFLTITWKGLNRYSPSRICSWMREKRIHDIFTLHFTLISRVGAYQHEGALGLCPPCVSPARHYVILN